LFHPSLCASEHQQHEALLASLQSLPEGTVHETPHRSIAQTHAWRGRFDAVLEHFENEYCGEVTPLLTAGRPAGRDSPSSDLMKKSFVLGYNSQFGRNVTLTRYKPAAA
jgi:hypothetical protein